MSEADAPLPTEVQQIIGKLDELIIQSGNQNTAINALGEDIRWIVEQTQGLFQMFGSPQFLSMLPQMMSQMGGLTSGGQGTAEPGTTGE